MTASTTRCCTRPEGGPAARSADRPPGRRAALRLLAAPLVAPVVLLAMAPGAASARDVELLTLEIRRAEQQWLLDVALRLTLPPSVEDALRRGVPLHFVMQAALYRPRWYWRDERVARASRTWRLTYQPLTDSYRVSIGSLHQTYPNLAEALGPITRLSQWRLGDAAGGEAGDEHYLEFAWRLDTSQLPRPMQIGIDGQAGWELGVERTLEGVR